MLSAASGPGALALVCTENGITCNGALDRFRATGKFTSVDPFTVPYVNGGPNLGVTATLSAISGYGAVLAWTDLPPADPTALGNLLASYYDLGAKRLTIATFAFSTNWAISGAVIAANYAALTNLGSDGSVSGNIVPTVADPIFSGITLSTVQFFRTTAYAHPALAPGAMLLATDGAGINMIARSANGVVNVNLFPGDVPPANPPFYLLLAATLAPASPPPPPGTTPVGAPALDPVAGLLLVAGIIAVAVYRLRRQAA